MLLVCLVPHASCLLLVPCVAIRSVMHCVCIRMRASEWGRSRCAYVVHARLSTSISINFYYPDHETSLHRFNFLIRYYDYYYYYYWKCIESQSYLQLQFVICNSTRESICSINAMKCIYLVRCTSNGVFELRMLMRLTAEHEECFRLWPCWDWSFVLLDPKARPIAMKTVSVIDQICVQQIADLALVS